MDKDSTPASRRIVRRAAALLIGAELLSGKVRDENLPPLARALRALGIELERVILCPDDIESIANDIRTLSSDFDLVVTSGGVGPTHDDVTIAGVAKGLGKPTVVSSELRELLAAHYGKELNEAHLAMAQVPADARLLTGGNVGWPIVVAKNVWIFPGVPELFQMKLAALRQHLRGPRPFFSEEILCTAEEPAIKKTLDELVVAHPDVEIGSYPKWFDPNYKTKLTFDSREPKAVERAAAHAVQLLGDLVVTVT